MTTSFKAWKVGWASPDSWVTVAWSIMRSSARSSPLR